MERIRQFVSAIISGLMIGVGGTIFLMQENTLAGSFLFSAGLMTILIFGFQLYTGKIGYIPFHKPIYLVEIIITWLGNVTGTYLFAQLIRLTRIYPAMADRVNELVAIKLNDQLGSVFVLSIFCGLLMFIVNVYCSRYFQKFQWIYDSICRSFLANHGFYSEWL